MKIKWLIILFIFFLAVMLLSLLITQQSQKAVSLSDKEIPATEQIENRVPSAYSLQVMPAPIAALPAGQNGITIIQGSSPKPEEKNISVSKIANKTTNNVSGLDVPASSENQVSPQPGTVKIGKRPTTKEAQEMNSRGIVLY